MKMTWHHLAFDEESQVGFGEYTFQMNRVTTESWSSASAAGGSPIGASTSTSRSWLRSSSGENGF